MLILISFIMMIAAYVVASGLGKTSSEVVVLRQLSTNVNLSIAKASLIAWVANKGGGNNSDVVSKAYVADQPGALPCPDSDDDGFAEESCSDGYNQLGRLPWKTLGLDDLRDSDGERFWYALSANFVKNSLNVINSDTRGALTIKDPSGNILQSKVVAAVIAPGAPVRSDNVTCASNVSASPQLRGSKNALLPGSYLEKTNSGTTGVLVSSTTASECLNDVILELNDTELFAALEPVVAARIERDIVPYLNAYQTTWTTYPFPVDFSTGPGTSASRNVSQYVGYHQNNVSKTVGLLPVASSVTFTWAAGSPAVQIVSGQGEISGTSCAAVTTGTTGWQCAFYLGPTTTGNANLRGITNPVIEILATIANVGSVLAVRKATANVTGASLLDGQSLSYTPLTSSASTSVSFRGTYTHSCLSKAPSTCPAPIAFSVFIPDPSFSDLVSSTNTTYACTIAAGVSCGSGWFISNEWYRTTLYAVAPGYLPAGGATCAAGTDCLSVSNLRSKYTASNDKRAILMLAGRTLSSRSAGAASVTDYLEGLNQKTAVTDTPGAYSFENSFGNPTSSCLRSTVGTALTYCSNSYQINDRVVVVAPPVPAP